MGFLGRVGEYIKILLGVVLCLMILPVILAVGWIVDKLESSQLKKDGSS